MATSDQYSASAPEAFIYKVPPPFQDVNPPSLPPPGLTAYQLALADSLVKGTTPPFGINQEFAAAMNTFASSKLLTPTRIDPNTLEPVQPPFAPGETGIGYVIVGDMICIVKEAEACGPGEQITYNKVPIQTVANASIRIWQYFGDPQPSGSIAIGTGDGGGSSF